MKRIPLIALFPILCVLVSSCASRQSVELTGTVVPSIAPSKTATITPIPLPSFIEVTTKEDTVNGDMTSLEKFMADPGADGISLREAIAMANLATGEFTIQFSPALAGAVIQLSEELVLTQSHITIDGLTDASGKPSISIYIAEQPRGGFKVSGSNLVFRNLRMTGLRNGGSRAGIYLEPENGTTMSDILIEGNIFEGTGTDSSDAISLRNDESSNPTTTIRNVTITSNTFMDFMNDADCIHIGSRGTNSLRENIVISGNTFLRSMFPIELEASGTENRIQNVQILNNIFADNIQPISIGTIGDSGTARIGNVTSDTLVYGNVFENNTDSTVVISGGSTVSPGNTSIFKGNTVQNTRIIQNIVRSDQHGISISGGSGGANDNLVADTLIAQNVFESNDKYAVSVMGGQLATGNRVRNTQIFNNVMKGNEMGAIDICGGRINSSGNEVNGVKIANNTIVDHVSDGYLVAIGICSDGVPENTVSGVQVLNSILWGNQTDFWGLTPDQVSFSITNESSFAGVNGNIRSDPLFVDPASGDYHLMAGSPAIDSGTSENAPISDFECSERFDDPATPNSGIGADAFYDMGAFEFDNSTTQCSFVDQP